MILIGLGGASGNILNNIAEDNPNDFKYLYINTDKKSIEDSLIDNKLHLDITEDIFWDGFSRIIYELSPINLNLINQRKIIQEKIDA